MQLRTSPQNPFLHRAQACSHTAEAEPCWPNPLSLPRAPRMPLPEHILLDLHNRCLRSPSNRGTLRLRSAPASLLALCPYQVSETRFFNRGTFPPRVLPPGTWFCTRLLVRNYQQDPSDVWFSFQQDSSCPRTRKTESSFYMVTSATSCHTDQLSHMSQNDTCHALS